MLHTWRQARWASWDFELKDYMYSDGVLSFKWVKGGFQGARGADNGDSVYIDNVFEELDMGYFNLFFF